ncbi:MAG: hypothetical protein KW802_00740 [Candidatus Doudnabacteria bacterium]|nr:hypothetical protein [Candidatus Doudnabacteria bacterium]
MKRAPRTTITWRFENPMAPHSMNYMPCPILAAKLVMVITTLFQGKARMRCWFALDNNRGGETYLGLPKDFLPFWQSLCDDGTMGTKLGLTPDRSEFAQAIGVNGDAVAIDLTFSTESGQGFTHTAGQKFIELCDAIGDPDYRSRFFLPYPEIAQVTMVEAYADNNWVEYGQWMWDRFFTQKADASLRDGLTL